MRFPLFVVLLVVAPFAHGATTGFGEAIASTAKATGMSYQFGTRCGADANLLARHKAKFDIEA